jgi:hypothetical protein
LDRRGEQISRLDLARTPPPHSPTVQGRTLAPPAQGHREFGAVFLSQRSARPHPHDTYKEPIKRDKTSLDIFWLRDESLGDSDDFPDPAILAAEIVEDLQAALDQFAEIAADLGNGRREGG